PSSTGSTAISRRSFSRRFTSTAAFAVGTAPTGGVFIGILKTRIGMLKRSSSGPGQNIFVSTSARRKRIAKSRTGYEPTSPVSLKSATSLLPNQTDDETTGPFERIGGDSPCSTKTLTRVE